MSSPPKKWGKKKCYSLAFIFVLSVTASMVGIVPDKVIITLLALTLSYVLGDRFYGIESKKK